MRTTAAMPSGTMIKWSMSPRIGMKSADQIERAQGVRRRAARKRLGVPRWAPMARGPRNRCGATLSQLTTAPQIRSEVTESKSCENRARHNLACIQVRHSQDGSGDTVHSSGVAAAMRYLRDLESAYFVWSDDAAR